MSEIIKGRRRELVGQGLAGVCAWQLLPVVAKPESTVENRWAPLSSGTQPTAQAQAPHGAGTLSGDQHCPPPVVLSEQNEGSLSSPIGLVCDWPIETQDTQFTLNFR